jgi:hypothetical protein
MATVDESLLRREHSVIWRDEPPFERISPARCKLPAASVTPSGRTPSMLAMRSLGHAELVDS